jgi:D-alanine transaminase
VVGGTLLTPPKSNEILPGITRDVIISLAREFGVPLRETGLPLALLNQADEAWISSSTREVLPLTRVDEIIIGDGRPGPLWRRFREGLQLRARNAEPAVN